MKKQLIEDFKKAPSDENGMEKTVVAQTHRRPRTAKRTLARTLPLPAGFRPHRLFGRVQTPSGQDPGLSAGEDRLRADKTHPQPGGQFHRPLPRHGLRSVRGAALRHRRTASLRRGRRGRHGGAGPRHRQSAPGTRRRGSHPLLVHQQRSGKILPENDVERTDLGHRTLRRQRPGIPGHHPSGNARPPRRHAPHGRHAGSVR